MTDPRPVEPDDRRPSENPSAPPRIAVASTGLGLGLMACFTVLWSSWALASSGGVPGVLVVAIVFWIAAAAFVVQAVRVIAALRRSPRAAGADRTTGRRRGLAFGIVFGAEGVLIGVAAAVLGAVGADEWTAPAVATVVGLHFIPFTWIFARRIDLVLGLIGTLVGIVGLVLVTADPGDYRRAWTFTGIGMACVTTAYGTYMTAYAQRLLARVRRAPAGG